MSEESSDAIYRHLVTSETQPDDILCVYLRMREYIKIIPNYEGLSKSS